MSGTVPTTPTSDDLLAYTTDQIDNKIEELINWYNYGSTTDPVKTANSFDGPSSDQIKGFITSTLLPTLQGMVGSNPATSLQEKIEADTDLDIEIIQAKEDMKIAEERVKSLRQKDKTSYYESWFPLNRPLRTSTNITLIALGIFFYAFVFLVILSSIGFTFNLTTTLTTDSPMLDKLAKIFPFRYGTILLVIALIIVVVVGYLRKA
jgi:hypothetical protein